MDADEIKKRLSLHTSTILGSESFTKYAVFLPLIKKDDGIHILFEERAYSLKRQPGDICFPGGKVDKEDANEKETAIRETMEELGLIRENIGQLFPLDYVVTPFNTIIFPFAGFIQNINDIQLNHSEVESIFTVPLAYFIESTPEFYYVNFKPEPEKNFPTHLIVGGKNYNWQPRKTIEYFFQYENRVVWGLTAKMLIHFIEKFIKNEDR